MARHPPFTFAIVVGIVTVNVWTHAARTPTLQDAKQADAYSVDDRKVLTAVIEHSIRPRVQEVTGRPSAVVFLIDHAAPVCDKPREPRSQPFCMFPLVEGRTLIDVDPPRAEEVRHRADSDPVWEAVVPSETHRAKLFASFKERNAARHSSAGHAVVSAFIDCGEKCGGVFMWLLEKRGADWQVRGRDMSVSSGGSGPDVYAFGRAAIFNGREAIYSPPISPLREPAGVAR